jgi:hypothetical protein
MIILQNHSPIYQYVEQIRYAIDSGRDLILEEWDGTVSAPDLEKHWREFLKHEAVINCRRTVADISKSRITVTGQEFSRLIDSLVKPVLKGRKWITAIVVASDYQFGVSRQYGVYAESYSRDQIFKDSSQAFDWISTRRHEAEGV